MDDTYSSQIVHNMIKMEKNDEFYIKIHYKFRSNLNLPSYLNEKYIEKCYGFLLVLLGHRFLVLDFMVI